MPPDPLPGQATADPINPSHYRQGEVECIDAIRAALGRDGFIAYCRGNVQKYTWRLGLKDDPLQEARKAKWYLDRMIAEMEKG